MQQTILDHVTFGLFTAALPDILGSVGIGVRLVLEGTAQSVRVGRRDLDCDGQSRNRSIEQDQLQVNRLKGGGIRPGI